MKKKLEIEFEVCENCGTADEHMDRCFVCNKVYCWSCNGGEDYTRRTFYTGSICDTDKRVELTLCLTCEFTPEVKVYIEELKTLEKQQQEVDTRIRVIVRAIDKINKGYNHSVRNSDNFGNRRGED